MDITDPSDDEARRDWIGLSRKMSRVAGDACPDANSIAEFIADTLTSERRQRFELHLASCGLCSEAVRDLQACLDEPLDAVPVAVVNRAKGVRLRLLSMRPPVRSVLRMIGWAAVVAVLLTGGGLGYFMGARSVIDPYQMATANLSSLFAGAAGPTRTADNSGE